MAEQLKINIPEETCLITIRTQNSKLWFVNNKPLEEEILGYLAKYQTIYQVILYGFILMGNHYHLIGKFPKGNRSKFTKAFNRIFANVLTRHESDYEGGHVWGRRCRPQALPRNEDILHWFFYTVCNPISSGLVESINDYTSFNSFSLSLSGEKKSYLLIDWDDYNNRKRYNSKLKPNDCAKLYDLTFSRLPGYEDLSQEAYKDFLLKEYSRRSADIITKRTKEGKGFVEKEKLSQVKAGSAPKSTKTSTRWSKRPLVLTLCDITRANYLSNYFKIERLYREASRKYRQGNLKVKFPAGTFRPTCLIGQSDVLA